jgi:hypothetical protein
MSETIVIVNEPDTSIARIYTVHTLGSPGPGYGSDRTPGFFFSLEDAKKCVEENRGDIHEMVYKYIVIEEFGPGLYYLPDVEFWYKWEGDNKTGKYVECDKPSEYEQIVCFGLG